MPKKGEHKFRPEVAKERAFLRVINRVKDETKPGRKPKSYMGAEELNRALRNPTRPALNATRDRLRASFEIELEKAAGDPGKASVILRFARWADRELVDGRRRVTPAMRERAVKLAQGGFRPYTIGKFLGISRPTAAKLVQGIEMSGVSVRPSRMLSMELALLLKNAKKGLA